MGAYWFSLIAVGCGLGCLGCALAMRYRPNPAWNVLMFVFTITLIGAVVVSIRQHMHHADQLAHIGIEQEEINKRLDALQAETASTKGPVDPAVAEDRRDRLSALRRDLNAIRKESDDLRNSGAGR